MAKVTMPQLGESVAEGTIGKWLKKPGDHVDKYEPLLEVITDKVNAEVPSPYAGTLTEILVEEGATVPNNAEIAVIEEAGAATIAAPAGAPAAAQSTTPAASGANEPAAPSAPASAPTPAPAAASAAPSAPTAAPAHGPAGSDERAPHELPASADARMTPAVRRLLREHGLQAAAIVGSGGGGRITREDVTDYVESQRTGKPVNQQDASAAPASAASATAAENFRPPFPYNAMWTIGLFP
ncbi:MAG: biotin/lipoyl-containing protein [Candidatus Limnocylindrales bacterium]